MSKPSKALREYLRELGRRGGKASAGRGVRDAWAKIPPAERSKIMRERAAVREKRRKTEKAKKSRAK
jgi:hypothetical protein